MVRTFASKLRRSAALFTHILAVACLVLPSAANAADDTSCASSPNRRALDFWIGEWSIASPGNPPDASSSVSLDLSQCVVVERWKGERNHSGENVFGYSADDQSWHGLFADNEGRVHVFLEGKATAGTAQFTGPSRGPGGETVLNRITVRRIDANHVEQEWQKSADNGKTWTRQFLLDYTRSSK
ncbi:MAG TPA: hypothetical protein VKB38_20070 [Terracidiphilus sp.]|nr:hypothetical protein [Terracidiphilus sp.]